MRALILLFCKVLVFPVTFLLACGLPFEQEKPPTPGQEIQSGAGIEKCHLSIHPTSIDFGATPIGCTKRRKRIRIRVTGGLECESYYKVQKVQVLKSSVSDVNYHLTPILKSSEGGSVYYDIVLSYQKETFGSWADSLVIRAGQRDHRVPVTGRILSSVIEENFIVNRNPDPSRKLDILVVVKNSHSMRKHHPLVAT